MIFGQNGIDTSKVDNGTFTPLSDGWYQAQIQEEKEQTTAKNGKVLIYTFSILGKYEGTAFTAAYAGRKVWGTYNVVCPGSERAEEIAMTEIARMGKAAGLPNVRNSSDLLMKIMDIRLVTEQDAGYEPKNKIKGYRASTSETTAAPVTAPITGQQAPVAPSPAPAGSNPPWGTR